MTGYCCIKNSQGYSCTCEEPKRCECCGTVNDAHHSAECIDTGGKGYQATPPISDGGKLLSISANLLKNRMSDFAEDYPKRFSKKVLREIQEHNERLRVVAIKIADIGRKLYQHHE